MPNRREVVVAGLAGGAWAATPALLRAAAATPPAGVALPAAAAAVPYRLVVDERHAAPLELAAAARARGWAVSTIRGDVTRLWYEDFALRWRSGPAPIIGMTTASALFVLERLAWDAGMRLNLRIDHRVGRDGGVEHAVAAQPGLVGRHELSGLARPAGVALLPALLARATRAARGPAERYSLAGAATGFAVRRGMAGLLVDRHAPAGHGMKALEQFDIRGRSALVTGAASGIGLAYAEAMAEAGARVTLTDVDGAGAEREAARLRATGAAARAQALDVADRAQQRAAFDAHVAAFGGLDICFANAGIGIGAGFWNPAGHRNADGQVDTMDPAHWDRTIAINLTGAYNTLREAVRVMKAGGKPGSIVATTSNAAVINEAIVGMPYMPAKAGLAHMVRHLAMELAEFRIRVNAIAPGPFVTNIGGGSVRDPVVRAAWDKFVPLGRMAETWQIKPLALYLASDASSFVTGAQVIIDGGMSLGKFK